MLNLPPSLISRSRDGTRPFATRRILRIGRWLLCTAVLIVAACTSTAPPPPVTTLAVSVLPCSAVVTAKDGFGNTASGYTGTVHFTSTDPAAVLPPNYTFVSADAGTHTFPVTLKTAGSQTVTATDASTSSITGSQVITVPALSDKPLYVANGGVGGPVTVYAAGASCNAAPMATIAGNNTGLSGSVGIALDAAGQLYVTNTSGLSTITIYAAGAAGNATPIATIAGSNTGLRNPAGITLDAAGQLYVANWDYPSTLTSTITVYAPGATGNAAPIATIGGNNTGLSGSVGIALDAAGQLYVTNTSLRPGGHGERRSHRHHRGQQYRAGCATTYHVLARLIEQVFKAPKNSGPELAVSAEVTARASRAR